MGNLTHITSKDTEGFSQFHLGNKSKAAA